MKTRIIVLSAFLALSFVSIGQETKEKYSFLKYNKNKSVKLKKGTEVSIYMYGVFDSLTKVTTTYSYYGTLNTLNDSLLNIDCRAIQFKTKRDSTIKQSYSPNETKSVNRETILDCQTSHNYCINPLTKSIDIKSIEYLNYTPKIRSVFETFEGLSMVTLLLVAPLISYNYSNGTFNGERYLSIAGPSLLTTATFAALIFSFDGRKVKIKH